MEHPFWGRVNLDLHADSAASELGTWDQCLKLFVSQDLYLSSGKKNPHLTSVLGSWIRERVYPTGRGVWHWDSCPDLIPLCLPSLESRNRIQTKKFHTPARQLTLRLTHRPALLTQILIPFHLSPWRSCEFLTQILIPFHLSPWGACERCGKTHT